MVIVNQDYRGQGLGKAATQACTNVVPKKTSIMLISTSEGKPLYEKMGFKEVGYVQKLVCNNYALSNAILPDGLKVEVLKEGDLEKVVEIDKNAFGDSRRKFLMNRIKGKLRIDTPTEKELFMKFLRDSGFEKVSQPPIMIINSDTMPNRNEKLYAIAAKNFWVTGKNV
jgi:hypothetical protein